MVFVAMEQMHEMASAKMAYTQNSGMQWARVSADRVDVSAVERTNCE